MALPDGALWWFYRIRAFVRRVIERSRTKRRAARRGALKRKRRRLAMLRADDSSSPRDSGSHPSSPGSDRICSHHVVELKQTSGGGTTHAGCLLCGRPV